MVPNIGSFIEIDGDSYKVTNTSFCITTFGQFVKEIKCIVYVEEL